MVLYYENIANIYDVLDFLYEFIIDTTIKIFSG